MRGDLSDVEAMTQGAEGCEAAFHLAAHVEQWGDWDDFVEGNVEGTRNALAACRAAGVSRFVHCGTEAAILAGEPVVNGDETLPAPARLPRPVLGDQGTGRAARARRERRRVRRRRPAPAIRLGRRRHDAPAGDRRRHPRGEVRLDRGRDEPHVDDTRGQRRRRPPARRREGPPRRGLLRARRRRRRVPRVHLGAPSNPGRRAARSLDSRAGRRHCRAGRRDGVAPSTAEGRAAAHPVLVLGGQPGMHPRRLEGARRAGLRARHQPRGRPRRSGAGSG